VGLHSGRTLIPSRARKVRPTVPSASGRFGAYPWSTAPVYGWCWGYSCGVKTGTSPSR